MAAIDHHGSCGELIEDQSVGVISRIELVSGLDSLVLLLLW